MAQHLTRRAASQGDDDGSIIMAMLLILVTTLFAALLAPIVLAQIHTSAFDTRRSHSLDAAQTGVDVALGKIRDANDGLGAGVLSTLPCTNFTPLTGSVSTGGTARYNTLIYYFAQDPRGHDDWIKDSYKQIVCATATSGMPLTPRFAVVVSQGTDSATGSFSSVPTRTIQATYVFNTKDNNIQGGLIHYSGSNPDLCLDAGSSSPAVGVIPTYKKCASGSDQQLWSFNSNLTVSLASTVGGSNLGLCVDATYPQATGNALTLQNCSSTTTRDQQYSWGAGQHFFATATDGSQTSLCWVAQAANTVGAPLLLGSCSGAGATLAPEPAVGAGDAGAAKKYLVDYNQFGRCLDVTHATLPSASDYPYLIAYPCKVTTDSTQTDPVNQQWNSPTIAAGATSATGQITTKEDSSYCLTSPMRLGGYPTMTKCTTPQATNQTWTVWGATGEYATSYRITDASRPDPNSTIGYCMSPTDLTASSPDVLDGLSSKIIVTTCSGATLQKWNAPPGVDSSPVKDYQEK